ncbi:hypothetical protein [Nostoc sp. EfeVER01]
MRVNASKKGKVKILAIAFVCVMGIDKSDRTTQELFWRRHF